MLHASCYMYSCAIRTHVYFSDIAAVHLYFSNSHKAEAARYIFFDITPSRPGFVPILRR